MVGRVRESRRVQQQLLHGDVLLPVRGELRDDLRHPLLQAQQAFLKEQPHRYRYYGLGTREDRVERLVRGRPLGTALNGSTERAHASDSPAPRHGHLRAGHHTVVHLALRPGEDRLQPLAVDADRLRFLG